MSNYLKPDLLYTIQSCKLDNLKKWIVYFMKTYKRLDKYRATWLPMSAYHVLTPKN
jgi:hypothetical protein